MQSSKRAIFMMAVNTILQMTIFINRIRMYTNTAITLTATLIKNSTNIESKIAVALFLIVYCQLRSL